MVAVATPAKYRLRRGCGHRKGGYIYVTRRAEDPEEAPLEQFVVCPPWIPWDISPEQIGVSAQGMAILARPDGSGIFDIYDWIGEHDYPYFPHFFVEGRYYGFSRLIPKTAPFKKLTRESRHLFIHPRAYIENVEDLLKARGQDFKQLVTCPRMIPIHDHPEVDLGMFDMCFGYLFEAVEEMPKGITERLHVVELPMDRPKGEAPSCTFQALYIPKGVVLNWKPAVIMWTEIDALEIPVDAIDNKHEDALKILEESGTDLPYMVTED